MLTRNNRQPYIRTPAYDKNLPSNDDNSKIDEISSMIVETLKLLSKNIESNKQSLILLSEKFDYLEERQRKLENQLGRFNLISNLADSDLSSIRNELKLLKEDKERVSDEESIKVEAVSKIPISHDVPIMQGTGFAGITHEYLRSLQNK